jgi:hypothetical protein
MPAPLVAPSTTQDLAQVLRRYGFLGLSAGPDAADDLGRAGVWWPQCPTPLADALAEVKLVVNPPAEELQALGPGCQAEPPGQMLFASRRGLFGLRREPIYRPLLPHLSFAGPDVEPVWTTPAGGAVLARWHRAGRPVLLLGLDVAAEVVRYNQGDPAEVERATVKHCFGFSFERANYLFAAQVVPGLESIPWADRLGFTVVRLLSRATGWPLAAPLPGAARGAVLLTGDDDEAALPLYREQLDRVGAFPITYYLLPRTHHTGQTLSALPASVELGLHVDALDQPQDYDRICTEQAAAVRALTDRPVRSIRNHGFLSRGYLGHLDAWQESGLPLDVNYAGLNGAALTGSFLPFPARRADGTWVPHYSLVTAFGDGMLFICGWGQWQASRRIRTVARQVEREDPGVLVFNMHPGNIRLTPAIHRTILRLGRRPGWVALGAESYLRWLETWHQLRLRVERDEVHLETSRPLFGLVLVWPEEGGWRTQPLTAATGTHLVGRPRQAA